MEISSWMRSNVDSNTLEELKSKHGALIDIKQKAAERQANHDEIEIVRADYESFVDDTTSGIYANGEVCEELHGFLDCLSSWRAHPSRYRDMQRTHLSGLRDSLNQLVRVDAMSASSLEGVAA